LANAQKTQFYFHFSRADESGGDEIDRNSGGSGIASKKALKLGEQILPRVVHLLKSEMGLDVAALELGQGLGKLAKTASLFQEDVYVFIPNPLT